MTTEHKAKNKSKAPPGVVQKSQVQTKQKAKNLGPMKNNLNFFSGALWIQRDRIAGWALAFHVTDLGFIPDMAKPARSDP